MTMTKGHKIVLASILVLAGFNVWLLSSDSTQSDESAASYPPIEFYVPDANVESPTTPVDDASAKHCAWPPEMVFPVAGSVADNGNDSGFELPKRATPNSRGAIFELNVQDRGQESRLHLGSTSYSGVEPMPFGGSMFGPWSIGRAPALP